MSVPTVDALVDDNEKQLGTTADVVDVEPKVTYGATVVGEHETEAVNYNFTYKETQKLLRRVDLHLIPLLMLAYLLKNVDGNILSYMKVMNSGQPTNVLKQLHMTANDWSYLSTVATVPFLVFDIPSNMILKWSTPRLHFCRIIFVWSVTECCMAACKNKAGILTARFFIGMATAGMFPGILVQLTMWYRPDELALRMACISMLGQFSGILDALLAYGVQYIDGRGGLSGWQWCFIILGLLGFPLCAAIFFLHPDYPDQTVRQWFTPEEAAYLAARLPPNAARSTDPNFSWPEIKGALKDPLTWGFGMAMLFEQTGTAGYSWWLPTIIAGFGFTSTANSQLLNIPPAAIYIIAAAVSSYYVDRQYRIPRPVFQLAAMIMMIGLFAGLTVLPPTSKGPLMALILLFGIPSAVFQSMIYPWRSQTVKGSSYAAFAFAFQNSIGQLAGIFSPQIFRSQYAPSYRIPFIVCNVFLGCTVFAILFIWKIAYTSEKETRRVAKVRRDEGKEGNMIADVEVHDPRITTRPTS
ncbi:MFS general substrate transporter [Naematelia encephala]|uniref:MFS general substrate transporter n=1 Tax=Naematelia encephala TaxID=71784 RepID=A0A1Y2BKY9_9TREE|nr:MFS general substrate transporter [Naematelia encephala]